MAMTAENATDDVVHISRVAKGKRPQYFSDPAIDKLLAIVLQLAGELSVTRERLDTVERLLAEDKVLDRDRVEGYEPAAEVAAEREAKRAEYIARVLRIVQAELEETTRKDMPKSVEDVLKHF
jgi:hypothetical protein